MCHFAISKRCMLECEGVHGSSCTSLQFRCRTSRHSDDSKIFRSDSSHHSFVSDTFLMMLKSSILIDEPLILLFIILHESLHWWCPDFHLGTSVWCEDVEPPNSDIEFLTWISSNSSADLFYFIALQSRQSRIATYECECLEMDTDLVLKEAILCTTAMSLHSLGPPWRQPLCPP